MSLTQHDRDRLEDLQLDPAADRTEDLRRLADETAPNTADLGGTGVEGDHTTTHQGVEVHDTESTPTPPTTLFHGWAPMHGDATDDLCSHGVATLSVTVDNVELVVPNAYGKSTSYTFSPADWSRLLELIDRSNDEPLPFEVTR